MYHPINGGTQITLRYGGYKVWIPPKPSESEIAGYQLKKSHQFFKRTELPDFWEERSAEEQYKREQKMDLWASGQIKYEELYTDKVLEDFRRQEWKKRVFGYWFYNNGEIVYITGGHYFYLNWTHWDHELNDGYPVFYDNQVHRFYFTELCEQDPKCLGYIKLGPRGQGKSVEEISRVLDRSSKPPRQKRAFIQSKSDDDARDVLFINKLVPCFNTLPDFFKPVYDHPSSPKNELSFKRQSRLGAAAKQIRYKPEFELINNISWAGAGEMVLDGETAQDIINDEVGKVKPHIADVYKRVKVNRFSVFRNNRKVGIIRCCSTVEDLDEGGKECQQLWEASDPEMRSDNGMTLSGLYRWRESILDTDTQFADEFGRIRRDFIHPEFKKTIEEYHFAEREARKHDPEDFADWIHKNPIEESDMWTKKPGDTTFNTQRLQEYKNALVINKNATIKGNFRWSGTPFKSDVIFEIDEFSGKWELAVLLNDNDAKNTYGKSNQFTREWSYELNKEIIVPRNKKRYCFGVDTIKDLKTKDKRASKMSAHIKFKYNDNLDRGKDQKDWVSNRYVGKYCYRHEKPETDYENVAMAMLYFGTWGNVERNVGEFHTYLKAHGMDKFYMTSIDFDEDASFQSKMNEDEAIQSTVAVQQAGINALRTAFATNLPHRLNYCPFIDTIDQAIDFDPKNITKFDQVVSLWFAELGDQAIVEDEFDIERDGQEASDWFPQFDITNDTPVLVEDESDWDDLED